MGTQQENAIINVVINGDKAISTFKDLNKARAEQLRLVQNLNRDSPQYQQQSQRLQQLTAAQQAWRKELAGGVQEQENLNEVVSKNPLPGLMGSLMESITGNSTVSKIFGTISSGLNVVTTSGGKAMEVITSLTGTFKLHKQALAEAVAAREALQAQMAANLAEQEALAVSLTAATTAEERNTIAARANKLAEEESAIATQLQTAAQREQIIATGASEAGFKALKIALASTGIGLLIVALASLVAYFEQTNEGSKKFKVIMAELSAIFQQIWKILGPIGKAIFDTFTNTSAINMFASALNVALIPLRTLITVFGDLKNGRFGQAWDDLKKGVVDFGENAKSGIIATVGTVKDLAGNLGKASDQISQVTKTSFADVAKQAAVITKARQDLTKEERLWSEEKIKQQGEVELLTKKLRDGYLTEQQRMELAKKATALREQIGQKDIALAQRNATLVQQEQALNSKKDYQAITDAKNRVTELTNAKQLEVQNIINRQSKLDNALKSGAETHKTHIQSLVDEAAKMQKDVENLGAQGLISTLAANDKEVAATAKKYDDQIALQQAYMAKVDRDTNLSKPEKEKLKKPASDRIDQLQGQKQTALNNLAIQQEQTYTDKIKEINEDLTKALKNENDKQRADVNAKYDQMIRDAGTNTQQVLDLEDQRNASLAQIDLNEKEQLEKDKQAIADKYTDLTGSKHDIELQKIHQRYDQERKALREKYAGDLADTKAYKEALALLDKNEKSETDKSDDEEAKQKKDAALQSAEEISNALFTISSNNRQADLDNKISALEKQKAQELSNANLTEAQKAQISAKYDKLEKAEKLKKWKADQRAALLQAIINGALAVTKALPNIPLAVAAGVAAAAQIAVIAEQKPPQFAKGGILPDGPTHSAGGLNVVDPLGNLVANIEGGEPILSRKTAAANPNLMNALLSSGGQTINYERILQAKVKTNNGTSTPVAADPSGNGGTAAAGSGSPGYYNQDEMQELRSMLKQTMQMVQATDKKPVIYSTRIADDHNAKMTQISDAVNG